MTILAGVDPGVHDSAVALYDSGVLIRVGFASALTAACAVVVVEKPQYDGRAMSAQVAIDLSWAGADVARRLAGPAGKVHAYEPRAWKGDRAKPKHHALVHFALTPGERAVLDRHFGFDTRQYIAAAVRAGALDRWQKSGEKYYPALRGAARVHAPHNIFCAVGLGLFQIGRLRGPTLPQGDNT